MSKKGITLSREDWNLVYATFCGNPTAGDTEAQGRRAHLWMYLAAEMEREGDPLTVQLTSPQRRILLGDMERPVIPWRTDAIYTRVWPIQEALGWTRPNLSQFDDEDEESDDA